MRRRTLLAAALASPAAATLAAPAVHAQPARVLRFVPDADLAVLDPIWTTSYQSRDHGLMVYDTLFGQDAQFRAQPQMLAGAVTEPDGLRWTLKLRAGLLFHDGTPVLARDCVASIRRWGVRDSFGQALMAATDEVSAADDATIVFRLKYPFPLLPDALAKTAPSICAIMPERLARTDAFTQVTEAVGSGPFRFLASERNAGARAVWQRFEGYVPRDGGAPSRTAGPKIAHFDRIEWVIIQDPVTASAALQRGEVDWWYTPTSDLLPVLRRRPDVALRVLVPTGTIATMRFNQLQKPFDNPAIRRALFPAITQSDYMIAVNGEDPSRWRDGVGYFCPGTPMASDAGMAALTGPRSVDAARRALDAADYAGEVVALLGPQDIPSVKAMAEVTADMLQKIGMAVDFQAMDWGTAVQRRARTGPPAEGGWSIFQTSWSGTDHLNPAGHVFLRGNGRAAAPGWPDSPEIERLRDGWLRAPDLAAQQDLARRMQLQAFQDVPYIPLGQTLTMSALRTGLADVLEGLPLFWSIRRA